MKVTQHNAPFNRSLPKEGISPNLISFFEMMYSRFSFDSAHIYHLTHHNINEYKSIIMVSIRERLKKKLGLSINDNPSSLQKDVMESFDEIVSELLPISMVIFDYEYASAVESSFMFFKENNDILIIDTKFSTLEIGRSYFMFSGLNFPQGGYQSPVMQVTAYDGLTTKGEFPLMVYLLPMDDDGIHIDPYKQDKHHKKAELQIRVLHLGQDKFQKISIPVDLIEARWNYDNRSIFNTRLIYNGEIIFSEYDVIQKVPQDVVLSHLLPFTTDLKSTYEIIDDIPVAMTAEYYQHFKKNIWPVIEMAKC